MSAFSPGSRAHARSCWHRAPVAWSRRSNLELGRPQNAEPILRSFFWERYPLSQHRLGKIYEQLEEYDKARESYEYFVHYWQDADPKLQPMVEEARQAIIRLKGLRRE